MAQWTLKRLWPGLLGILAGVMAWRIYALMIVPAGPFRWDEAAHALRGLAIAEDVGQGSWLGFLLDSYRQVYWPPLHSWLTALAFLIAGPDMMAARLCSLFTYLAALPFLYLAARSMRPDGREIAGGTAVILFLTSPSLIDFASQCMLEAPGLLALILTIFIYFKACGENRRPENYALLGLGVAFTYLVKSNYGILLFLAVLLTFPMDAKFHSRSAVVRAVTWFLLPLGLIFSIWFAYPAKILTTWEAMVNAPFGVAAPYGMEGWLFYPRALVNLAGSAWFCLLLVLALLASLHSWRNGKVRFLLILVLLQMFLGEIHHDKMERHILPVLPAMFLLAGNAAADLWARLRRNQRKIEIYVAAAAGGILLWHAGAIAVASMRPYQEDAGTKPMQFITAAVRDLQPALVLGNLENIQPPAPFIDWHLIREGLMTIRQAGSLGQVETDRNLGRMLERSNTPAWLHDSLLPLLRRSDLAGISRTLHVGLPANASYSQGKEELNRFLRETLTLTPCRSVIVVAALADGTLETPEDIGLRFQTTRLFPEAGVRVDIYEALRTGS